ncbi:N-acyl-D-amino-acid deacylase family protein [Aliikangiella coralliicola]|uniref:Amidohydrolase family protein n=1 Tax=Aliikangiella coralliicola TaxID=2592383 RepID=A0A545UCH4_9GAMM|nr:amidohydrolase family protein [Aliikangiella coralliicola]TQV87172.1 amidohydrolase family protein [Aliikangiella coralliicola]
MILRILVLTFTLILTACAKDKAIIQADILITSGLVYSGDDLPGEIQDVAVCGKKICFVGQAGSSVKALKTIDAKGKVVTPGFIDPHTHSLQELLDNDHKQNFNYLTQGVTTVINGNDGDGTPDILQLKKRMQAQGIGTNVGLLVGHGAVRKKVMGISNAAPNETQLEQMKSLIASSMENGALGFSTGLYYVPGSYSKTDEVSALAKVAANYGGVYDSHIRDESTFNIGFLNAVKEVIQIAKEAKIKAHIAHIKALGVDVWGQSEQAIQLINKARSEGIVITADQYPWQASGTFLHSAVIPAWVMADSKQAFTERLNNKTLLSKIKLEVKENIRRRGGPKALLVTASKNESWLGKTLEEIALNENLSAVDTAIKMVQVEDVRVASFNMSSEDINNFMVQPWVVSSSDGTDGHPRKYASFPKKYQEYVVKKKLISPQTFIHRSSGKTADIFGIKERGRIRVGYYADINVLDFANFLPQANFSNWNQLSTGVVFQLVNGTLVISKGENTGELAGVVLQ